MFGFKPNEEIKECVSREGQRRSVLKFFQKEENGMLRGSRNKLLINAFCSSVSIL